MNNTDTQVLFDGLDSITNERFRRAQLKQKAEQAASVTEQRRAMLAYKQQQATEVAEARLSAAAFREQGRTNTLSHQQATLKATTEYQQQQQALAEQQAQWAKSGDNPLNQMHAAQAEETRARANSLGKIPKLEELAGIRNLRQTTEDALIAAEQSGDPIAVRKAQRDVDMAERTFNHFLKAKEETGHVEEQLDASGRLISRVVKRPFDPQKDGQGVTRQPQPPVGAANKAAKRVTIKTREEFAALPSGTPFILNGQAGIKH